MAEGPFTWEGQIVGDGRYLVIGQLGKGGMGTVYRAQDKLTGQIVALKTPRLALLEEADCLRRFLREMKALAQLQHPHLVPVLDIGEHNQIPFIIMGYLPGGSLRQRLRAQPARGPEGLFPWLRQIASALDYLHSKGIVHRDVKPENVLFGEEDNAYLADLGAVKALEGSYVQANTKLTQTGTTLGTPAYMAPELVFERPYDGRADQYSLAVMVYEALAGQHPYPTSPLHVLVQSLLSYQIERLDRLCGAPVGVADAVARGLARDPAARFNCCREFAEAVHRGFTQPGPILVVGAFTPNTPPPLPQPDTPTSSPSQPHEPATPAVAKLEMGPAPSYQSVVFWQRPLTAVPTDPSHVVAQSCQRCGARWRVSRPLDRCPKCRASLLPQEEKHSASLGPSPVEPASGTQPPPEVQAVQSPAVNPTAPLHERSVVEPTEVARIDPKIQEVTSAADSPAALITPLHLLKEHQPPSDHWLVALRRSLVQPYVLPIVVLVLIFALFICLLLLVFLAQRTDVRDSRSGPGTADRLCQLPICTNHSQRSTV